MLKDITILLTACGRPDLLFRTLESLDALYPLEQFAEIWINEDRIGTNNERTAERWPFIKFVPNPKPLGHMAALTRLYRLPKTKFAFHCEDDWQFKNAGFLEESVERLNEHEMCLTVTLKPHNGLGKIVNRDGKFYIDNTALPRRTSGRGQPTWWPGFNLNPGLRKTAPLLGLDYCGIVWPATEAAAENALAHHFHRLGYYSAACARPDGHIVHLGDQRHIQDQAKALLK